jgi:hypothetical protein
MLIPIPIPEEVRQLIHYSAITGFIVFATLLINLNHKAFNYVMKDNAKRYWWLFVIIALIPLSLFLYIFSLLFDRFII